MSTTTLQILVSGEPVEVALSLPDRATRHALALSMSPGVGQVEILHLQVIAVALAWPGAGPWAAVEATEVARLTQLVQGDEVYLRMPSLTPEDRRQAARDLAAHREELSAAANSLAKASVRLGPPDTWAATADRVLAAIGCPAWAVYQAGDRVLEAAIHDLMGGWAEYKSACDRGFTPAPAGVTLPGA